MRGSVRTSSDFIPPTPMARAPPSNEPRVAGLSKLTLSLICLTSQSGRYHGTKT